MLYQELVSFRNQCAQDMGIPPFLVASNKLLGDLCVNRPSDTDQLNTIDGVSDQWINKFSQKFLDKIRTFCGQHTLLKLNSSFEDVDGSDSRNSIMQVCLIDQSVHCNQ